MSNRPSSKPAESPLVTAARAIEAELERWREALGEASRMQLSTDKTLHRAKSLLEQCATTEQTMAAQLHLFVTAMQEVQKVQHGCMQETVDLARRVEERVVARNALLERFSLLGQHAGEINVPVAAVMNGLASNAPPSELLGPLQEVAQKTDEVVAEAEGLAQAARESDWKDIAREVDSLKQQIQSVKNKVETAHRNVASRAPS